MWLVIHSLPVPGQVRVVCKLAPSCKAERVEHKEDYACQECQPSNCQVGYPEKGILSPHPALISQDHLLRQHSIVSMWPLWVFVYDQVGWQPALTAPSDAPDRCIAEALAPGWCTLSKSVLEQVHMGWTPDPCLCELHI